MAKKRKGDEPKSKRRGRKPKLQPDDKTCREINQLAQIQCTQKEAASVLGVCENTFNQFLRSHLKAREAWEMGREEGKASLRRMQWRAAERSTAMLIWLGKQHLGQTDKLEQEVAGNGSGPVQLVISPKEAAA
jgi:hypothetical protein